MQKKRTNLNLSNEARENLRICANRYTDGNWSAIVERWAKQCAKRISRKQ